MAKSSGVSEGEIREGFICPICLCDLKTVDQLQNHFETAHASEDHDVFQTFKGFIGRCKFSINYIYVLFIKEKTYLKFKSIGFFMIVVFLLY